jgi:hypothetical protein
MSFSGTTSTDFMKLAVIPEGKKQEFIDYAGNDFYALKNQLLEYIKAVYPLDYQNFSESDLGVMLVEVVSYMGAAMSLKGDMLANENYIRTVKNRDNLKKLLELIGVDMKGPLGAAASARLTAQGSTITAADFPITYTAGNRVFSIPSKEDGAPVNYTLYKLVNNTIQDLQGIAASFQLNGDEADNAASSVFSNVAMLEGQLSVQTGSFDSLEGNKRISLTDSPIIDGSVQVFINTNNSDDPAYGAYNQVERLFAASGATDKVFQVAYDTNYAATVIFGDNILGISPPAGAEFTVAYRIGGGSRGNINPNIINVTTPGTSTAGGNPVISFVTENISAATGGSEAETSRHAKKYAPYTFKRQERVVTLEDFISIGNTFRSKQGTVGKTTAAVRDAFSSANVIDMYVLEKASDLVLQKASSVFKQQLLEEIEPKKMLTDEVVIVDGLIRTLDLVVTVRIDRELQNTQSQIEQQVANVILDYFNIDNTDFGKNFVASELNRNIFRLPSVRYSTVDNLPEVTPVDFHEIIQLNNFTINTVLV